MLLKHVCRWGGGFVRYRQPGRPRPHSSPSSKNTNVFVVSVYVRTSEYTIEDLLQVLPLYRTTSINNTFYGTDHLELYWGVSVRCEQQQQRDCKRQALSVTKTCRVHNIRLKVRPTGCTCAMLPCMYVVSVQTYKHLLSRVYKVVNSDSPIANVSHFRRIP